MSIHKSFLRWAGSKTKLLPVLREFWNPSQHKRYVEPFMGSAALFFALKPDRALLSDINSDLVATFIQVRDNVEALHSMVSGYEVSSSFYYDLRKRRPADLSDLERAARFVYLNRNCYNGLYRTNLLGEFNVPFSGNRSGKLPDLKYFRECSAALQGQEIVNTEFSHVAEIVKPGDFVYLDPPYAVKNTRIFRQYSPDTFGTEDIVRLRRCLASIVQAGGDFVLSYASSPEIDEIKNEWSSRTVMTYRNIAGFAGSRKLEEEVLITNIGTM